MLLLQVAQQVDDLRLDRHVERRDRLVGDDELRVDGERARDADALALAARELVRVARARGRATARPASAARRRARAPPRPRASRWIVERLVEHAADRQARVQARVRDPGRRSASGAAARASRGAAAPTISCPSNFTLPAVGSISRRMQRPVVVLPQPLSPTSPSTSPARDENETPSTALARARRCARTGPS